ncbi:MAG TPA: hypothetical protein GX700_05285 [Paracoccus sp.]|nr:hypothetical protein [Paracoccus sp. (in: a-proteobacteria)]
MTRPILALIALSLVLAGCSGLRQSRINPLNWFGASSSTESALGPMSLETDNRALVPVVTAMSIERTSSGALVRAEAQMPGQGWWDAALVAENNGRPVDGVLSYRFVAAAPRAPVAGGRAQMLVVAAPISEYLLEEISTVVVRGASNSRSARR